MVSEGRGLDCIVEPLGAGGKVLLEQDFALRLKLLPRLGSEITRKTKSKYNCMDDTENLDETMRLSVSG